jgi:hypothetical protein
MVLSLALQELELKVLSLALQELELKVLSLALQEQEPKVLESETPDLNAMIKIENYIG